MKTQVITRKIKLFPVGDKEEINRVYKYIRDGMTAQNLASNQYISALYIAELEKISKEDKKELKNLYTRISSNKKGSAYSEDIKFARGLATTAEISQRTPNAFSKACKDGLMYGRVSLPTFRKDNPLWISSRFIKFINSYENYNDFLDNLYNKDLDINIKFINGIVFKVILGNPHKSAELRSVIKNIFEESYKVCGSSIQIDDKDIILNLSLQISINEIELDENIVVGVDLGIAIPAVCGLNTNDYIKQSIGNVNDFVRVRTKIQAQKRQLQKSLKYTSGGHGRNKKLQALDKFSDYERNFIKTYNHMISKNVVEFAIKNKAKYINLEDLSGFDASKFILRNWSYYELQQQITYKAKLNNIEVRYINPYHTSQICSKCGHWEEGQRDSQSHFNCKKCGYEANADFNASRNIALSKEFIKI